MPTSKPPDHRQADSRRRSREAALLQRLEGLVSSIGGYEVKPAPLKRRTRSRKITERRRQKLEVLEASVRELERLRALLQSLEDVARDKDVRLRTMARVFNPKNDSGSTLFSSEVLLDVEEKHHLYSSLFIHGRVAMSLLDVDTGTVLDANRSRTLSHSSPESPPRIRAEN